MESKKLSPIKYRDQLLVAWFSYCVLDTGSILCFNDFLFAFVFLFGPLCLLNIWDASRLGFDLVHPYRYLEDYSGWVQIMIAIPFYIIAREPIEKAWVKIINHINISNFSADDTIKIQQKLVKLWRQYYEK